MDKKYSERLRTILISQKIPKWVWVIVLVAFAALVGFGFLISSNNSHTASTSLPGNNLIATAGLFFNITIKLGMVILMIYVFLQLLKRWQDGKQSKPKKYLSVVESTYLNPRQSLHLVKAGDKLLLLGSTDQSVTCLTELASDILVQETSTEAKDLVPHNPNPVQDFASILAQSCNKR